MKRTVFVGTLVIALAAGCDPATGVVRTIDLTNAPPNEKVESALRDVVGAEEFERLTERDGEQWSVRNGLVVLEIKQRNNGVKTLEFHSLRFGSSTLAEVAD